MAHKRKRKLSWIPILLSGVFLSLAVPEQTLASEESMQIACGENTCTLVVNQEENWITLTQGEFAGDYTALQQALGAESIRVYYASTDGEEDGNLRTGDVIMADGVEYQISVLGDVDGNGLINVLDMDAIQQHVLGVDELNDVCYRAASMVEPGKVSVLDMEWIQKVILGEGIIRGNGCAKGGVHRLGDSEEVELTCEVNHTITGTCRKCGEEVSLILQEANGHQSDEAEELIQEATTDQEGILQSNCTVCEEPLYTYLPKLVGFSESYVYIAPGESKEVPLKNVEVAGYQIAWGEDVFRVDMNGVVTSTGAQGTEGQLMATDMEGNTYYTYLHTGYTCGDLCYYLNGEEAVIQGFVQSKKDKVKSLEIPATVDGYTVTGIAASAFSEEKMLEEVTLPGTLTDIKENTFYYCKLLKKAVLGEGIETTGAKMFSGCVKLEDVTLPETLTTISGGTFAWCSSLTDFEFPKALKEIGAEAFIGNKSIVYADLPESVEIYGNNAFDNGIKLTVDKIPEGVTYIGYRAFGDYAGADEIELPVSIENVQGLHLLKNVTFAEGRETIPDGMFQYMTSIEEVTLPKSLTSIGGKAFIECTGLKKVVVSSNLTSIGNNAFDYCTSLETVEFAGTVGAIGSSAFEDCTALTLDDLPDGVVTYGTKAFYNCTNLYISEIPEGVEQILDNAFAGCKFADELDLPASVTCAKGLIGAKRLVLAEGITTLESELLSGNTTVSEVILPDSLTRIGNRVFNGCTALKTITIPKNVNSVPGAMAVWGPAFEYSSIETVYFAEGMVDVPGSIFAYCGSLKKVVFPGTVKSVGQYAFTQCSGIEEVVMEEGLVSLSAGCFSGCTNLKTLVIPSTLEVVAGAIAGAPFEMSGVEKVIFTGDREVIPGSMFFGCSNLKTVILPDTVKSIGNYAFSGCSSLSGIEFPEGLTSIGDCAFSNCTSLTEVTIPKSVTYMGSMSVSGFGSAFEHSGVTTFHLPEGWTQIPASAFANCNQLTSIELPSTVTQIGDLAFAFCSGLEEVKLSDELEEIGNYVFQGCTSMTEFTIPETVTTMGYWVFYDSGITCMSMPATVQRWGSNSMSTFEGKNIKKVIIEEGVVNIPNEMFAGCAGLAEIEWASTVNSIGSNAFTGCTALEILEIPESVTSIGGAAFAGCQSLKELHIPVTVTSIGEQIFMLIENMEEYPVIYTKEGSVAHNYAVANGYRYQCQE